MFPVHVAMTPSGLLTIAGLCALGWSLAFGVLLLARSRAQRLTAGYQRQLRELSSLCAHREREREGCAALLQHVRQELFGLRERHFEVTAQLEAMQRAVAVGQPVKHGQLASAVAAPLRAESTADVEPRLRKVQDALAEMRRGRELAEQRAETLRVANQDQMRKIVALAAQLQQQELSIQQACSALTDKQRELTDLQEQMRALTGRFDMLVHGREQLELQNLELKRMLDQLEQPPPTVLSAPAYEVQPAEMSFDSSMSVAEDWHRVTESDIGEVIVSIAAQTGSLERGANSGTFPVATPVRLVSESRELSVAPLESAVLSDSLGLPIAGKGSVSSECLAAVSGLALSNAERVRELLPVGPITTVQWVDQYGMVVTCRLLHLAGDEVVMTTLSAGTPSEEALRETLESVLSSIGWNDKGPLQEDVSNTATG